MTTVNIHEAKAHLSALIERVRQGEEVVIAKRNVPIAKLVLLDSSRPQRRLGTSKGLIEIAPDFDATPPDFGEYA